MKIVCRQYSNVTQSLSKEAAKQKLVVSSKRDMQSRRSEILRTFGKSIAESDVTEGYHHIFISRYIGSYCCYLVLVYEYWTSASHIEYCGCCLHFGCTHVAK